MSKVIFSLVVAGFLLASPVSAAENFPSKAMEIISNGSPGSGMSLFCQAVAKTLSGILKVPVNVIHKSAGNGAQAVEYLKSRPADGYTMIAWSSGMATFMHFKHFNTKPEELYFLCDLQRSLYSLIVPAESPFRTAQDLIDYAKKNPGKLEIGSAKVGAPQHMHVMNFADAAGIEVNYVPYGGTGETLKDVLGGHLRVGLVQPFLALPHVAAGKVRILLTMAEERLPELPDVPVPADIGLKYPFYHQGFGMALRAGTPPERIGILTKALKEVSANQEFKDYANQSVGMISVWRNNEEYAADFLRNYTTAAELIKKYNININ